MASVGDASSEWYGAGKAPKRRPSAEAGAKSLMVRVTYCTPKSSRNATTIWQCPITSASDFSSEA